MHPNDINNCHIPPDHGCHDCDDQLPLISRVGRGIRGDSARVNIVDPDTCTETYLEGGYYDGADGIWHSEWVSENINGGELSYQYNLRPYTIPRTFTITFIYRRPGRCEWSWTTPAIPYIWGVDGDGSAEENPDAVVGSGVATLFIRASYDDEWNERLHYPPGTTRDDFNAPLPEEPWSATITFGYDGDVKLPNFDDLAKIIGCTKQDIFNILEGDTFIFDGIEADNLLDYINKCDKRDRDHFHKDLGFDDGQLAGDGGKINVKNYIDKLFDDLLKHIYGNPTRNPDGSINWPNGTSKIAVGNLNFYAGDNRENWIKTDVDGENDVWQA